MLCLVISVVLVLTNADAVYKNESLQSLLYSNSISCQHDRNLNLDVSDVMVYLYDFQENFNASFKVNEAADGIYSVHPLQETRKLIVYVQGYKADITWKTTKLVQEAFHRLPNIYLIIIDYSMFMYRGDKAADFEKNNFENSIMYSFHIGKAIGEMIAKINAEGFPSRNIHCIGTSMGGQIVGYIGEAYLNRTHEKIRRITGIDPVGPCFSNTDVTNQLRSGLADYVEVYHCNDGMLGTPNILGDIDVYLNKDGRVQPNCELISEELKSAECSHKSCLPLFKRSVANPELYTALACDSYKNYVDGKCVGNELTTVGYFNPCISKGVFYLTTEMNGQLMV